jgi:hypothetical protein
MDGLCFPPLERRLQNRYVTLVKAHMHEASPTAAGPTAVLAESPAFAATQAAWRFFNNDRVTLSALAEPLREAGRHASGQVEASWLLLIHDWSKLKYGRHRSKQDTVQLTHQHDIGYELATALLVSGDDGSPLAPMQMFVKTAAGMFGTDPNILLENLSHLDQVMPTMEASRHWGVEKPIVHVIDREADSVDHYRRWDASGHRFLVRGDDRCVRHENQPILLSALAERLLTDAEQIMDGGTVQYGERQARCQVVETEVVLHKPGRKREGGKQREVTGRCLPLRLVVSRVVDEAGKTLTTWYLLSNVPGDEVEAKEIAQWYCWRWRIESYFKLLKSHGHQIEHWQQESGPAITRRLLVAAMACVVVWDIQRQESAESTELKDLLVRLSGRQMKRNRPHTAPALFAGLFVLLRLLAMLEQSGDELAKIKTLVTQTMPFLDSG